jgi:16S rRNA processing protein RimM
LSAAIALGRFGRPHGVRGALWLWPHNESSDLLKAGRILQVGAGPEDLRAFEVEEVRREPSGWVVRLKGVTTREAAGSLNGMVWYEARENFPAPAEGEYYHVDLLGMVARDESGAELGQVADVWAMPASDVLVIRGVRELLVPFVETYIGRVDAEARVIHLTNTSGLLEPEREPEGR